MPRRRTFGRGRRGVSRTTSTDSNLCSFDVSDSVGSVDNSHDDSEDASQSVSESDSVLEIKISNMMPLDDDGGDDVDDDLGSPTRGGGSGLYGQQQQQQSSESRRHSYQSSSEKPDPMGLDYGEFSEDTDDGTSLRLGMGPRALASPVKSTKGDVFFEDEPLALLPSFPVKPKQTTKKPLLLSSVALVQAAKPLPPISPAKKSKKSVARSSGVFSRLSISNHGYKGILMSPKDDDDDDDDDDDYDRVNKPDDPLPLSLSQNVNPPPLSHGREVPTSNGDDNSQNSDDDSASSSEMEAIPDDEVDQLLFNRQADFENKSTDEPQFNPSAPNRKSSSSGGSSNDRPENDEGSDNSISLIESLDVNNDEGSDHSIDLIEPPQFDPSHLHPQLPKESSDADPPMVEPPQFDHSMLPMVPSSQMEESVPFESDLFKADQVENYSSNSKSSSRYNAPSASVSKAPYNIPISNDSAEFGLFSEPDFDYDVTNDPIFYPQQRRPSAASQQQRRPSTSSQRSALSRKSSLSHRSSLSAQPGKSLVRPEEAPILLAPRNDPMDYSERSQLTETFEDEASMDFVRIDTAEGGLDDQYGDDYGEKNPDLMPTPLSPSPFNEVQESMDEDQSLSDIQSSKSDYLSPKTMALAIALVCVLVFLAALAGGLLGAFAFGKGKTERITIFITNPPTQAPPPTLAPTWVPTDSPTVAPSTSTPTLAPSEPIVIDQELFDTIAAATFGGGTSIRVRGSPQQKAFVWMQNTDNVTNFDRRILRGSGARRQLALSTERILQRYAMAVLYYATNGQNWTRGESWLDANTDECNWISDTTGRGCPLFTDMISRLEFEDNNLEGSLPPELGLLTSLRRLGFVGDPEGGHLTGSIPEQIGLLSNLNLLRFRGHRFAASLSDDFFSQLGSLTILDLANNLLSGIIPNSIGNLTGLQKLFLNDNGFSGEAPDAIGMMEQLTELELQNNALKGAYPANVTNMTFILIESFDVSNNNFSGPLPDFSGWTSLREKLDFSDNAFTGPLPDDSFESIRDLKIFRARNNLLSGGIPPSIMLLENLEEFDISGNNLVGNITEEMCVNFGANSSIYADCVNVSCACCFEC